MQIKQAFPPNISEIAKKFDISDLPVVFTYGNILYNPTGEPISDDLMAHEEVHERQQTIYGVEKWWRDYLDDEQFRLSQEVEAYKAQYDSINTWSRDLRRKFLRAIANNLSSRLYGKIITSDKAKQLIKQS